mmetsp:Transcript_4736/g.6100  ORF Transcript_4736/g.6100 Transcript_4736/m.6100 type:complete len:415 (+) Transcript_4736:193-1437(+)
MTQRQYTSILYSVLLVLTTTFNVTFGFTTSPALLQHAQRQRHSNVNEMASNDQFASLFRPLTMNLSVSRLPAKQRHNDNDDNDNKNGAFSKRCPFLRTVASTAGEETASKVAQSKLETSLLPTTLSSIPSSSLQHHQQQSLARSFFTKLDGLYTKSSKLKCPFWRRRAADTIDSAAMTLRFLLIRHKSLGLFDPFLFLGSGELYDDFSATISHHNALDEEAKKGMRTEEGGFSVVPGCKAVDRHTKYRNLDVGTIAKIIQNDWTDNLNRDKGYYITGRLNSTIYRDDCLFDGPDPDMPVRGLRKYLSAASHLFDTKHSFAQLLHIDHTEKGGARSCGVVEVRWRLGGILMLPWRPVVKPWTGTTRYHLDEDGLIYYHEEMWDISALEAFVCTGWPGLGEIIWGIPGDKSAPTVI